jgi:RNA polymerase sigma-70 factor, ECF subfamily
MSVTIKENFADLLSVMLPRLWEFSLRLCRNRHDAEALLQRSCIRGLESVHQLEPGTTPLSWMFSIVQSTWFSEPRPYKPRDCATTDLNLPPITSPDSTVEEAEDARFRQQVIAAVDQLPETQRLVVLLVAVEGLSYAEAAKALNLPIRMVMSRLSSARQRIGTVFCDSSKFSAKITVRSMQTK